MSNQRARKFEVHPGQRFGRGVVVRELHRKSGTKNRRYVEMLCDCGKTYETQVDGLKNRKTQSCGCYRSDKASIPASDKKCFTPEQKREVLPEGMKRCVKCQEVKEVSAFGSSGMSARCKPCIAQQYRIYHHANPDKVREKAKRYRDENREAINARRREWYQNNKEVHRSRMRVYQYGITREQFDNILEAQGNCCAICGRTEPTGQRSGIKTWSVDHNHNCCPNQKTCGKCLRGVLDNNCNKALGLFNDDPETIHKAIAYVERGSIKIPDLDEYVPRGKDRTRRDDMLYNRYRIREVHYDYLLDRYGGCMICGAVKCHTGQSLAVDHDDSHCRKPKEGCQECIRGILCSNHNKALGLFNHDPKILRSAAEYLEKWNGIFAERQNNYALAN